jgi:hypothetical protein
MKQAQTALILLAIGAGVGTFSARHYMDGVNVASPVAGTSWQEIRVRGESLDATYRAGHFMRQGQVPPPKGTRFYVRSVDDEGNTLRGDCLVSIEGRMPEARWWLVSAATNDARQSLDVAQAVREPSGETVLAVSSAPATGNWLTPPGTGAYELQLVLLGIDEADNGANPQLPKVRRLWC